MWKFSIFVLVFLTTTQACIQMLDGWKQVGLEERAKRAPIVFHGLAIEATPEGDNSFLYSVQFWMINIYKGSESVAALLNLDPGSGGVFNLRDRRINVTGFGDKSNCHGTVAPQKYYIIFCEMRGNELVAKFDDLFGATADWSEKNEERVWHGIGWENWSDWGACSASCGEGSQERIRKCVLGEKSCHGYNKERRRCNMFSCQGAVDPMKLDDRRFFHPSRGEWERVPGRPTAWKLRPNSYIWVPSSQIFPNRSSHRSGVFPREFTLLVTLKLNPSKPVQGTLFSLRSRRQQDAYLSLELEAADRIRIVHAGKNGTQAVIIPMKLNDGHWHQLGLALQDDNSVRSFLDCAWVSTDILKRNELDHPEDADLIIGYLFQGELEQLVIVPNPSAVAQQCSSSRIPIYDPLLEKTLATTASPATVKKHNKHGWSSKGKKRIEEDEVGDVKWKVDENEDDFKSFYQADSSSPPPLPSSTQNRDVKKPITLVQLKKPDEYVMDDNVAEGSGNGPPYNETNYEVEWSDWSDCSTTCGPGTQSRYSRCIDDGSQLELCMEAGGERTETRSCSIGRCESSNELPPHTDDFRSSSTSDIYFSGQKPDLNPPTQTDSTQSTNPSQTDNYSQQNISEFRHEQKYKSDEVLFPSDIYLPGNHTVVPKKHHKHHKTHYKRLNSSESWNVLKKRILKAKGSKKKWCTCMNGGTCHSRQKTCECPDGYYGRHCEKVECRVDCLHGGYCLVPNVCTCPPKYGGSRCENPICDPPCRNGGTCIKPYTCLCPSQTSGSYCQKFSCRSPCLNGGTCVGPDQCECPHNATGNNCQNPVCDPPCENGATCSAGNWCLCDTGSAGIRCEKRKCEYQPVQEPYTRGFRRLVSKKIETKCEPWSWKTCTRTVPEYQTVYKTFYRTVYKCKENNNKTTEEKH